MSHTLNPSSTSNPQHLYTGAYRGVRFHVNAKGILALSDTDFKYPHPSLIWEFYRGKYERLLTKEQIMLAIQSLQRAINAAIDYEHARDTVQRLERELGSRLLDRRETDQ